MPASAWDDRGRQSTVDNVAEERPRRRLEVQVPHDVDETHALVAALEIAAAELDEDMR